MEEKYYAGWLEVRLPALDSTLAGQVGGGNDKVFDMMLICNVISGMKPEVMSLLQEAA